MCSYYIFFFFSYKTRDWDAVKREGFSMGSQALRPLPLPLFGIRWSCGSYASPGTCDRNFHIGRRPKKKKKKIGKLTNSKKKKTLASGSEAMHFQTSKRVCTVLCCAAVDPRSDHIIFIVLPVFLIEIADGE